MSDYDYEAEERRMAEELDRELDADRDFYLSHPHRIHRVRPAFSKETDYLWQFWKGPEPGEGTVMFVAVRQVNEGLRMRMPFAASPDIDLDMSEEDAAAIFRHLSASDIRACLYETLGVAASRKAAI